MKTEKKCESYEQTARYLLHQFREKFGLKKVEGKQAIKGKRTGATYRIDAKGVCKGKEGFLVIECRRYTTSRQKQEQVAALAYRIQDAGASGGIIVSPLGIQKGAKKIAAAENIHTVLLDESSTKESYILQFLNQVMVGRTDRLSVGIIEKAEIVITDLEDKSQ